LGIEVVFKALPWQRSLKTMMKGKVDGTFAASYKKGRLQYGNYPMDNGKIDAAKRLHMSGYSLYVLNDSDIKIENDRIINVSGKIGAQRGFSIVESLKKMELKVDYGTSDPVIDLNKLLRKRIDGAALQSARADNIIENDELLKGKIRKIDTNRKPFNQKPYFLMLSKQLMNKYPGFAEKFWGNIEKTRESENYKNIVTAFFINN
jgi:polar amino acid transport system substrate-binding protein